jgi:DNA-binding MarR family transcriptional regulator
MANARHKADGLKLEDRLCFPLYVASRLMMQKHKLLLDPHGITYTQYIVLSVLYEQGEISVKDLGARLYLDSGTLTPLLKKLEHAKLVTRERSHVDERILNIKLTNKGKKLEPQLADLPSRLAHCMEGFDYSNLKEQLYILIENLKNEKNQPQK